MKRRSFGPRLTLIAAVCSLSMASVAQQTAAAGASTPANTTSAVPKVVNYRGRLTDLNGKPLTEVTGVTFLLYREPQSGAPLWLETQSVQPGKDGRYSVTLGSTTSGGLPEDVFVSGGEARWLAVQIQGQNEQSRVLLVAAPYALKSQDAETLGGLPASAFLLAAPPSNALRAPQRPRLAVTHRLVRLRPPIRAVGVRASYRTSPGQRRSAIRRCSRRAYRPRPRSASTRPLRRPG